MLHRYTLGKLHTYVLYACCSHIVALNKQQAASVCFKALIKLTLAPLSPCKWNAGLCFFVVVVVVVVFTKSLIHANKCLDLEAHTPHCDLFVPKHSWTHVRVSYRGKKGSMGFPPPPPGI